MRLALYQGPSPHGDVAAAFQAVEATATAAAAVGADLALFPEVFIPGYNIGQMVAEPLDGDWVGRLRAIADATGVAIVTGMAEREGEGVFNSAIAVGPGEGLLASYRKIQLWGDREATLFGPGQNYVTFPFKGRTVGLLICYDVEFPEHVRALAVRGADLILIPTANMKPFDNINRYAVQARAMENGITVAYCNFCGQEGDLDYVGLSLIAGPEGDPLAMAGPGPALLIADIPAAGDPRDRPTEHLQDLRAL